MDLLPEQDAEFKGDSATAEDKRLLLARELQLERRRLQLVRANGLAFYTPHPGQHRFHIAGDKLYRMVRCGNRWGKSTAGCAEDLAWCLGERPWYKRKFTIYNADGSVHYQHDGHENHPYVRLGIPQRSVKGLVIVQDWDKCKEVWTGNEGDRPGKLWLLAPKGAIVKTRRNHSGTIDFLTFSNGSTIQFDTVESFKKNPQSSESSDFDFIHVDEPCPEGMFKANARGLVDRHGAAWFTLTPLTEFWINDLFFPMPGVASKFPVNKLWKEQGKMSDNPHNTAAAIQDFMALLTPDEIECRMNGLPLELSGLVYKNFNYTRHVYDKPPLGWQDINTPPKEYIIHVSVDTHPQTPMAVLFSAVGPDNRYYIFDELFVKCSVEDLANLIQLKIRGYFCEDVKCEPGAWIHDPITESSIAEELCKNGLFVQPASKAKAHGILKMQALFRANRVFVASNLQRFMFEINRYCYDKENKPIDKDDHLMECMYRTFVNDPSWYNPDNSSYPINDVEIRTSIAGSLRE